MDTVSTAFRAFPAELSAWQGPASVAFAGASIVGGAASAGSVLDGHARAVREYADEPSSPSARPSGRSRTRDAQRRIERAEEMIADVRQRQADARDRAAGAAADERRARHMLEQAREDLERAKRQGEQAEEQAEHAAAAAAAALGAFAGGGAFDPLGAAVSDRVGVGRRRAAVAADPGDRRLRSRPLGGRARRRRRTPGADRHGRGVAATVGAVFARVARARAQSVLPSRQQPHIKGTWRP